MVCSGFGIQRNADGEGVKLDNMLSLRVGDDKDKWQEAAKKDGFKSLGTWIKWVVAKYLNSK